MQTIALEGLEFGWEAGIRTPITWFRGASPDVDGDGSRRLCEGFRQGPLGRVGLSTAVSCAVCQVLVKIAQFSSLDPLLRVSLLLVKR